MVKIRARKVYASLVTITSLSISLLVNSISNPGTAQKPKIILASATFRAEKPQTSEIEYIVITETPVPTRTPTPTPIPTRVPTRKPLPASNLDEIMEKHAKNHGVDRELLKRIAHCESRLNPGATNGIYGGLYQFSEGSWKSARTAMNENPDPGLRFDSEEAVKTAAFKISRGGTGIWPNCGK